MKSEILHLPRALFWSKHFGGRSGTTVEYGLSEGDNSQSLYPISASTHARAPEIAAQLGQMAHTIRNAAELLKHG